MYFQTQLRFITNAQLSLYKGKTEYYKKTRIHMLNQFLLTNVNRLFKIHLLFLLYYIKHAKSLF